MHVLMITSFFEPDSGAAAARLTRLAKMLVQRGHRVTVLTTLPSYPQGRISEGYRGKWGVVEDRDGVEVVRAWLWATPSPRISRKLLSQLSFMVTAALRGLVLSRPDVIFIESQPVFTGFAGAFLSRFKRVPYVLNVSDLWPEHLLSVGALSELHLIYRLARQLVNATYRGAAGIVAMSPIWAERIAGYIGTRTTIEVILNGVDLQRFRPDLDATAFRHKYKLGDASLVTFIGTLATQYDVEGMIAVAQRFADRSDTRFVFVGSGSQSDSLRRSLNVAPNVRWIGWVDPAEIPMAWAASAVTYWVMRPQALYRGTIPAKMYEAFACGVPVAASTEGVAAQMIADSRGGICVSFGDVESLAAAINQLLDNAALRQQYSRAARHYAEQHFAPERVTNAYETLLLQVSQRR